MGESGNDETGAGQASSSKAEAAAEPQKDVGSTPGVSQRVTKWLSSPHTTPLFLLFGHLCTLVCSLMYVFPMLGFANSYRFYKLCLRSVVITCLVKLHHKHGLPPLGFPGFSKEGLYLLFESLRQWFTPVQMSTDFHYMFIAMAVTAHPPLTIALAPPTCLALYHAVTYLNQQPKVSASLVWRKAGSKLFEALRVHQRQALVFNAAMEIGLLFSVLARLFTRARSVMLVFMVFNTLKMRYKSPESNYYHRMVWGHVSSRFVEPYLLRFVPQLRGPLGAVQQFFLK
ncbi:hypothetical protein HKI87_19g89710 [Chloropicon roscoffensis]|uniref:Transmembrane protein 33 n=1 Tax=Chloropicon roscoffensis TaxID=1461544 RepID=A0AAX4PN60_9CHLO|mmetsp:Transcript_550/g.1703  ORF Transcript_550/g.1703 Transcript_550/m.1703 type:complete len:285 (-) Transcript_550:120-974(-)